MAVFYFITSSVMFISCDDSETKANKSQYNDSVSNRICATDLSQCPSDVVCLQESDTHCGSACVDCTLRNEVCSNGACICPDSMLHCNGNACVAESDTACGQSCANCVLNGEICIDGACQCPNNMRHCGEGGQCTAESNTSCGESCADCSQTSSVCVAGACICNPSTRQYKAFVATTEDLQLKSAQYPGETEFTLDDPETTDATNALPYHVFEVHNLPQTGVTRIAYEGATRIGERIAIMAWQSSEQKWAKLIGQPTDDSGQVKIEIDVPNAQNVDPATHTLRLMAVQELAANGSDTIIFTGDTQNYTSSAFFVDGKPNGIYNTIMTYARDEYLAGRAAYFHHAGDMTNNTSGESMFEVEQQIASEAHKIIEDVGMPNGVSVGNHDTFLKVSLGEFNIREYFEKTFPPSRFENFFWYGKSDLTPPSHYNHYVLVTIANRDFIVINSGYDEFPYDWLNATLATYAHRIAIVGRHSYLRNGKPSQLGDRIYRVVVARNANVKLVLCGHTAERDYNIHEIPNQNRSVVEIVVDHSNYYPYPKGKGAEGYLRLISFRDGKMINTTYSPYRKQYLTAADGKGEEFTLDFELPDTERTLTTRAFSAALVCSAN